MPSIFDMMRSQMAPQDVLGQNAQMNSLGGPNYADNQVALPQELYENPVVDAGALFPDAAYGDNPFLMGQGQAMGAPGMPSTPMQGQPLSEAPPNLRAQLQDVLLQKAKQRQLASQQFQKSALDTSQVSMGGQGAASIGSGY